jgi:hypothetical protein
MRVIGETSGWLMSEMGTYHQLSIRLKAAKLLEKKDFLNGTEYSNSSRFHHRCLLHDNLA